jgi:hypothetical protein
MECRVECLSTARALLGLADGAGRPEIAARYRALARAVHPDKGGSALLFQLVGQARELLLDTRAPPKEPPKAPAPKKPKPKPKVRRPPDTRASVPPPVRPPHTFGGPSEQHTFGGPPQTHKPPPAVRRPHTFGGPSEQNAFGSPPPMFSTPAPVGGAFGFRPAAAVRPLQSPDSFGDSFGFRHATPSAAVSLDQFGNSFA